MRPSKLATYGYVVLVFLTGAVAGGFAYRLSMSPVAADVVPQVKAEKSGRFCAEFVEQARGKFAKHVPKLF